MVTMTPPPVVAPPPLLLSVTRVSVSVPAPGVC